MCKYVFKQNFIAWHMSICQLSGVDGQSVVFNKQRVGGKFTQNNYYMAKIKVKTIKNHKTS